MRLHTSIGAGMLLGSKSPILHMAEQIARCHHEHWDGLGYPAGLAGWDIPECARIVAIVDVFDALTHDRVYRPALSSEDALSVLRDGRGSHFDPDLLDLFFERIPEFKRIAQSQSRPGSRTTPSFMHWPASAAADERRVSMDKNGSFVVPFVWRTLVPYV